MVHTNITRNIHIQRVINVHLLVCQVLLGFHRVRMQTITIAFVTIAVGAKKGDLLFVSNPHSSRVRLLPRRSQFFDNNQFYSCILFALQSASIKWPSCYFIEKTLYFQ